MTSAIQKVIEASREIERNRETLDAQARSLEDHQVWHRAELADVDMHNDRWRNCYRFREALAVAVEALQRQQWPHVEQFCKERAKDTLARIERILAGEEKA
jgi:hypothetical protein